MWGSLVYPKMTTMRTLLYRLYLAIDEVITKLTQDELEAYMTPVEVEYLYTLHHTLKEEIYGND